MRLDAIARWLQDVAYADLLDAGFDEGGVWIVRRLRLRVEVWPRFGEPVDAAHVLQRAGQILGRAANLDPRRVRARSKR